MNQQEIDFIRGCLPRGRTKYYTFRDKYVFQILSWILGSESMHVRELKAHPLLSRFVERPSFVLFLRKIRQERIDASNLNAYWPRHRDIQAFRLTLAKWGDFDPINDHWNQTTRRGFNLVLQINYPVEHGRAYHDLNQEKENPLRLGYSGHPVRFGQVTTMSWARIDIDLGEGTALIEEIQTDWLRDAREKGQRLRSKLLAGEISRYDEWRGIKIHRILRYLDAYIEPLVKFWDEVTLETTLWFLKEELGVNQIYYHTWETGLWCKRLTRQSGPPRSLYERLPKRFGFVKVNHGPGFIDRSHDVFRRIKKDRLKTHENRWWHLNLNRHESHDRRD
ncbi:MAG: hypothetical protein AAGJ81_04845 [Verrucomicrobiota bacterium]